MELLATENPQLLKEFESFAASLEDQSKSVPPEEGGAVPKRSRNSLDTILEETVRNIQRSSQKDQENVQQSLLEMMSNLQLESTDSDEGIMKAMESMMGTLLSKEVLYPSIKDLCSQVCNF